MNDRRRPDLDSNRRAGAERRAASAFLANYIHELSDRHGGDERSRAGTGADGEDRPPGPDDT